MLTFAIYLAGIADNIKVFSGLVGFIFVALSFCYFIIDINDTSITHPVKRSILTIGLILSIVGLLTPDKQTITAMTAVYIGQEITKDEAAKRLLSKSLQAVEIKLDEVIKQTAD